MAFVQESKGATPVVSRAGLLLCSAWVQHTDPARGFTAVYSKIYKGLGEIPVRSDNADTQEAAVKLINALIGPSALCALEPSSTLSAAGVGGLFTHAPLSCVLCSSICLGFGCRRLSVTIVQNEPK